MAFNIINSSVLITFILALIVCLTLAQGQGSGTNKQGMETCNTQCYSLQHLLLELGSMYTDIIIIIAK